MDDVYLVNNKSRPFLRASNTTNQTISFARTFQSEFINDRLSYIQSTKKLLTVKFYSLVN